MPTYEYRCTDCGHDLEAVQKFSDDPLTECPACGGKLRKVYNAVGIVFKGSGFYKTDNRSTTSAPAKENAGASDGGSQAGESTSSGGSGSATPSGPSGASANGPSSSASTGSKPAGTHSTGTTGAKGTA